MKHLLINETKLAQYVFFSFESFVLTAKIILFSFSADDNRCAA